MFFKKKKKQKTIAANWPFRHWRMVESFFFPFFVSLFFVEGVTTPLRRSPTLGSITPTVRTRFLIKLSLSMKRWFFSSPLFFSCRSFQLVHWISLFHWVIGRTNEKRRKTGRVTLRWPWDRAVIAAALTNRSIEAPSAKKKPKTKNGHHVPLPSSALKNALRLVAATTASETTAKENNSLNPTGFRFAVLSLAATESHRLTWHSLGCTGFYWALRKVTRSDRVLNGFYVVLLGVNGFQELSMGLKGFELVLMGFKGFHWVWLGLTGF